MIPLLFVLLVLQTPQPAPGARTPDHSTAIIRGVVRDRESGAPIPHVIVELGQTSGRPVHTRADEQGHYEFTGLPAGAYNVFAMPGEFRATHLRAPYQGICGVGAGYCALRLQPGEIRPDVHISLPRALALRVRVVDDESGEPMARVPVRVRGATGGDSFYGGLSRATDDRGMLRAYGLSPGRYIVCAEATSPGMGNPAGPRQPERPATTCYPSALSESEAEAVPLTFEGPAEIIIRMRRSRTVTISGTVLDASGAPAGTARLMLNRYEGRGASGVSVTVAADGRFRISGVLPGEYDLAARLGSGMPGEPVEEMAYEPVSVAHEPLTDVVLQMSKVARVPGRIIFEDGPAPRRPENFPPILIRAQLANDPLAARRGTTSELVREDDLTFELKGLVGARRIAVLNVPRNWHVKAVRYRNRDTIDQPVTFEAGADAGHLEIVLSTQGAAIRGRVIDDSGLPVRGARIALFPVDKARWPLVDTLVRSFSSSAEGTFRVGPLRPGEYYVIALDRTAEPTEPAEPRELERLAVDAERIRLLENEERDIELRLVSLAGERRHEER